jgi:hypothetical protein
VVSLDAVPVAGSGTSVLQVRSAKATTLPPGARTPSFRTASLAGARPWLVVLCRPSDVAVQPHDRARYQRLFGNSPNQLDHYFREASYNQTNLGGTVVLDWQALPRTRSSYVTANGDWVDIDRFMEDALTLARTQVNVENFYGVAAVINVPTSLGYGGVSYELRNNEWVPVGRAYMPYFPDHAFWSHEIGHGFGLPHTAYVEEYDNWWDPMGSGGKYFNDDIGYAACGYQSSHRRILGWIGNNRSFTAPPGTDAEIRLDALSTAPGLSNDYLLAEIPIWGLRDYSYFIEARRLTGYDQNLYGEGVIIHKLQRWGEMTRAGTGAFASYSAVAARLVPRNPSSNPTTTGAPWLSGSVFTDPESGVRVEIGGRTEYGWSVRIVNPPLSSDLHGLTGTYFSTPDLSGPSVTRIDPALFFFWGPYAWWGDPFDRYNTSGQPHPQIAATDRFSVRWTGILKPETTETYTFHFQADDAVRFWLDGVQLLDVWNPTSPDEHTATMALQAGRKYTLRAEFREDLENASAKLYWSTPTISRRPISRKNLLVGPSAMVSGQVLKDNSDPLPGVTLSAGIYSTVTGTDGRYSLELPTGSQTITPSFGAQAFTPPSRTLNLTENVSGVDFRGQANLHISGRVLLDGAALAGVVISTPGATATTKADGTYSLGPLAPGTYTVTPARTGYRFAPVNRVVELTTDRSAISFTATKVWSVSGRVTRGTLPLAGVTLRAGTLSAVTAANGRYILTGLPTGTHTITPTLTGRVFTPASKQVTMGPDQVNVDFNTPALFTVSGKVLANGAGISGIPVLLGTLRATTTATGEYRFEAVAPGSYVLKAEKDGYVFTPATRSIAITTADVVVPDITAQAVFSIRGFVRVGSTGLAGVTVAITGKSATTAADGSFAFTGLAAGNYTLTPTKATYVFTPATRAVSVGPNREGVNFAAEQPPVLATLTLAKAKIKGGKSVKGTLTLTRTVPSATTILVQSTSSKVPTKGVVVPAGKASAAFTLKTKKVKKSTRVTISASFGGVTRTAPLTVAK